MKAIEGSPSSGEAGEAAVGGDIESRRHQYLYLLGRPTLRQYLRFVDSHAVAAPGHPDTPPGLRFTTILLLWVMDMNAFARGEELSW